CANGQGRAPNTQAKDVGFRCCEGPTNAAEVNLSQSRLPPMVEEPSVETTLAASMLKAMPSDHRTMTNGDVVFDKMWRWHPRVNEEMLVGRWAAKSKDGKTAFFEHAVFKACSGIPVLVARMTGPAEHVGAPGAGADPQRASFQVQTGADK